MKIEIKSNNPYESEAARMIDKYRNELKIINSEKLKEIKQN